MTETTGQAGGASVRTKRDAAAVLNDPQLQHCRLLSIAQVASLLSLGRTSTYRLLQRQHDSLPAVRIGGSTRVPLDALERWIRREQRKAGIPT